MSKVGQSQPLKLSRLLRAPLETVFNAWSTAEHVKSWFSPATYTAPEAVVVMEVGGPFEVCMRSPTGQEHWTRGVFVEVVPGSRLVIQMTVFDQDGAALFHCLTAVDFIEASGGTLMEVTQTYSFINPAVAGPMVEGALAGWGTTLDKLDRLATQMPGGKAATERSVVHATFHLERTYQTSLSRLWDALTLESAKSRWFSGPPGGWKQLERRMDVRAGGSERLKGEWPSGLVTTFDATYFDVVPEERLVYSYEMWMDDRKISVTLATIQLRPAHAGVTLLITEQGAFLDGYDDAGSREKGTFSLMDAIGESLADQED